MRHSLFCACKLGVEQNLPGRLRDAHHSVMGVSIKAWRNLPIYGLEYLLARHHFTRELMRAFPPFSKWPIIYPRSSTVEDKQDATANKPAWAYHSPACLISRSSQNVASLPAAHFEALFLFIAVQLTRQFRHPKSSLELLRSPPCFSNRLLNLSSAVHVLQLLGCCQSPKCHKANPRTSVIAGNWISIALRAHWKQNRYVSPSWEVKVHSQSQKRKNLLTLTGEQQRDPNSKSLLDHRTQSVEPHHIRIPRCCTPKQRAQKTSNRWITHAWRGVQVNPLCQASSKQLILAICGLELGADGFFLTSGASNVQSVLSLHSPRVH